MVYFCLDLGIKGRNGSPRSHVTATDYIYSIRENVILVVFNKTEKALKNYHANQWEVQACRGVGFCHICCAKTKAASTQTSSARAVYVHLS